MLSGSLFSVELLEFHSAVCGAPGQNLILKRVLAAIGAQLSPQGDHPQ